MIVDLTGSRAIVTGSTTGIGFAIAKRLAESGAEVVVNGRTSNRVEAALAELRKSAKASLRGVAADVSTAEGVDGLIQKAGEADILVNNVTVDGTGPRPFHTITDEDWRHNYETSLMSGVRLSRHYLPNMVQRGWGRVVFISSTAALSVPRDYFYYAVTKLAQLALSRGLAESVAGTGVTVNAVVPGPTRSERTVTFPSAAAHKGGVSLDKLERAMFAPKKRVNMIGRLATADEVASMVIYVCSKQAQAITGAALRADGGAGPGLG